MLIALIGYLASPEAVVVLTICTASTCGEIGNEMIDRICIEQPHSLMNEERNKPPERRRNQNRY